MNRDDERDPHLREALRHAPDAQLQPPPALSALILQEARAKARDAQPVPAAPAPGPLAALWAWLARPAVATGFAGVMAATLVGVMWWDQPMDEALPRSPVPATAPAAEAYAEAPPASAPAAAPPGTEARQAKELAAAGSAQPAAAKPARTATLAKKSAEAEEARQAERKQAGSDTSARLEPPAEDRKTAARPVERQVEQLVERAAATADRAAPADTRAAPLRESAMPPPAPALAAAPAAPPLPATAPSPGAAGAGAASPHATFGAPPAAPQRLRAKAELNETRARLEAEAFTGIASLRAEVATDPSQWQWQRGNGAPQAMSDAVYAWLAQLDTATARRWEPARASRTAGAPLTRELQLRREGRLQHSVWLTEREVLWQRGQTAWRVVLTPEQLAALKAALDTAAP